MISESGGKFDFFFYFISLIYFFYCIAPSSALRTILRNNGGYGQLSPWFYEIASSSLNNQENFGYGYIILTLLCWDIFPPILYLGLLSWKQVGFLSKTLNESIEMAS